MPDYTSGGSTTHLSVIDKDGIAVSLTQTLLSLWGSRVTVPGTGILLNNGMMWFDPEPGRPNSVAGGKRPLSNMAPAVVLKDGRAVAALGASGGRRIMNCVAQIAMNLIDHGMTMQPAVERPADRRLDPRPLRQRPPARGDDRGTRGDGSPGASSRTTASCAASSRRPACVQAAADGTFRGGVDPAYFPATAEGV